MTNSLLSAVKNAANLQDQTAVSTGFTRTPPAEGVAVGRFVQYIELGNHVKQFDGKDKPSAPQVRVGFELHGRHVEEREVDGEIKKFHPILSEELSMSLNAKAGFKKLFTAMVAGRAGITHMSQMLGEAFLIRIVHSVSKKDPKKVYANFKEGGAYTVSAPVIPVNDDMGMPTGEVKKITVPEHTNGSLAVLLWDAPSQEMWDSLFIDGTYTRKEGDTEVEVSKNFLQETVLKADNFAGSPLESLIGAGTDLSSMVEDLAADATAAAEQEIIEEAIEAPVVEEVEEEVSSKSEEEMLKEMGLL